MAPRSHFTAACTLAHATHAYTTSAYIAASSRCREFILPCPSLQVPVVEGAVAADIVFLCPGCTLPSGLQVNPRTGQLYGLPTAVGVFPGTVIVAHQKYARRQRHAHPCTLRN